MLWIRIGSMRIRIQLFRPKRIRIQFRTRFRRREETLVLYVQYTIFPLRCHLSTLNLTLYRRFGVASPYYGGGGFREIQKEDECVPLTVVFNPLWCLHIKPITP
jgi:hypothetical protein